MPDLVGHTALVFANLKRTSDLKANQLRAWKPTGLSKITF